MFMSSSRKGQAWLCSSCFLLLVLEGVVGQQQRQGQDNNDYHDASFRVGGIVFGVTICLLLCLTAWNGKQVSEQQQAFVEYEREVQQSIRQAIGKQENGTTSSGQQQRPVPHTTYFFKASLPSTTSKSFQPVRTGFWKMQFVPLGNSNDGSDGYRITGSGTDVDGATKIVHGLCGPRGLPAYWKEERLHRVRGHALLPAPPKHILSTGSFDFATKSFSNGKWINEVTYRPGSLPLGDLGVGMPNQGMYGRVEVLPSDDETNQKQYQPPPAGNVV